MCPDRKIISLYHDEELPSPWKEKMETHLESCPDCRAALAKYRRLGESLGELPPESIQAAQDRVWQKLNTDLALSEESDHLYVARWRLAARKKIWKKSITLPLPALAAAAAAIIIVFVSLLGVRNDTRTIPQNPIAVLPENIQVIGDDHGNFLPVQDMTEVLRYLSRQDGGDFMVIRLPESKRFYRTGEPTLINAADYSRSTNNLRRNAF